MKIVQYYKLGGPEVLQIEEVEIPRPAAGQVVVKVEAIDVAYIDAQLRSEGSMKWRAPSFPVAPGGYAYGIVTQVGPDVSDVHEGEHMLAYVPSGAYAEYAVVPLSLCYPLPIGQLSPVEAVALPASGETAYHVLATSAQLRPGESVLIHAAAGGVGHLAIQLARAMKAGQIIATSSTATKLEFAQSLGADTLINYSEPDWAEQVRQATGGKGVDVILEMVGGRILLESMSLLAPFGRLITYGAASGNSADLSTGSLVNLIMEHKRIQGFSWFALMKHRPDLIEQGREALRGYVEEGKVRPHIMRTFTLDDIVEAHRLLESRASYGKIVVCPLR